MAAMGEAWVLTEDAVKSCIAALRAHLFHPFFPAYLHLRERSARASSLTGLRPDWREFRAYLEVGDAQPTHPYFRPFTQRSGASDGEWLNANLAGSWAPSSLRAAQPPRKVVEPGSGSGTFNLLPNHWELAREHLAGGTAVPLIPLAGFFFRDFAFRKEGGPPDDNDLARLFLERFGYSEAATPAEIEVMFDQAPMVGSDWFQLIHVEEEQFE